MVNSCRECENCQAGNEQYCIPGNTQTYGSVDRDGTVTYGGYSDHVVVDQDFVLRIPDGLELDAAAPLLCAGITTYSPLRHWNAGPGKQVAVVGLGGLGHMAVKLAKAMGAEVTVLSQSLRKQEDGLQARRRRLLRHQRRRDLRRARPPLRPDHQHRQRARSTSARFLGLVKTDGALVNVGAPPEPLPVPAFPLLMQRRSSPARRSARSARRRRCSTSAPSTASPPRSRSSPPTRSTRRGSACSPSDVRYRFVIDNSTL